MKKLFSYLLIFFLISMILCQGEEQEAEAEAEETEAEEGEETQAAANAYGGACTTTPSDSCTDKTTQQCTNKACAASQTCDSNNKCVCATGYKENSDKSGCEKDSSDSYSPFIKNSLMILLGITVF